MDSVNAVTHAIIITLFWVLTCLISFLSGMAYACYTTKEPKTQTEVEIERLEKMCR